MNRKEKLKQRLYSSDWAKRGRPDVIYFDVQPICKEQLIKLTFISQNSPHWQGVRLAIDIGKGGIQVGDEFSPGDFPFVWGLNAPKEVICKCTTNKGLLRIYNIYVDKNEKWDRSLSYGCGMLLEERGDLLIYHCNDYGFETNFDKLVFSIEKLPCG